MRCKHTLKRMHDSAEITESLYVTNYIINIDFKVCIEHIVYFGTG